MWSTPARENISSVDVKLAGMTWVFALIDLKYCWMETQSSKSLFGSVNLTRCQQSPNIIQRNESGKTNPGSK